MTNGNSAERYDGDSEESRRAFRDYDLDESVASKTPWQVWRDACAWQARAALSVCADGGNARDFQRELAIYFEDVGDPHGATMIRNFAHLPDGGKGEAVALTEDRIDWLANAHCPGGVAYPNNVKHAIRDALREASPQAECAPRSDEYRDGTEHSQVLADLSAGEFKPMFPELQTPERAGAEKDAALLLLIADDTFADSFATVYHYRCAILAASKEPKS